MNTPELINPVAELMEEPKHRIGPGSRLRLAREQANLSLAEVAVQLHLSAQLIEDIENDNYGKAPKFVFLRGYLRAYANLLNLPADEVIGVFNQLGLEENPSDRPVWSLTRRPSPRQHKTMRWGIYIISFVFVALVGIWWHSHKPRLSTQATIPTSPTTTIATIEQQGLEQIGTIQLETAVSHHVPVDMNAPHQEG